LKAFFPCDPPGVSNGGIRMGQVLYGARPLVAEVLEQATLDRIMPIASTEADALAQLPN